MISAQLPTHRVGITLVPAALSRTPVSLNLWAAFYGIIFTSTLKTSLLTSMRMDTDTSKVTQLMKLELVQADPEQSSSR